MRGDSPSRMTSREICAIRSYDGIFNMRFISHPNPNLKPTHAPSHLALITAAPTSSSLSSMLHLTIMLSLLLVVHLTHHLPGGLFNIHLCPAIGGALAIGLEGIIHTWPVKPCETSCDEGLYT